MERDFPGSTCRQGLRSRPSLSAGVGRRAAALFVRLSPGLRSWPSLSACRGSCLGCGAGAVAGDYGSGLR